MQWRFEEFPPQWLRFCEKLPRSHMMFLAVMVSSPPSFKATVTELGPVSFPKPFRYFTCQSMTRIVSVCLYTYACVYIYTHTMLYSRYLNDLYVHDMCMHVHIYIYIYIHTCTYTDTDTDICIDIHIYIYTYIIYIMYVHD